MLKKIMFVLLVFTFMIAGALVSMAGEDEEFMFSRYTVNNAIYAAEESYGEKEYSHQSVINMYSSLFFDADSKTSVEYIKDITVSENGNTKDNDRDYYFSATLSEQVRRGEGNIVIMFFVKNGNTYDELISPEEIDPSQCMMGLIELIDFELPDSGEDNQNELRIVVFLKNNYMELSLDNIQIYDTVIKRQKDLFNKRVNLREIMRMMNIKIE